MDVIAKTNVNYDLNIQMSNDEIKQLVNELEILFIRSVSSNTLNDYPQLVEFKNLLTLSINNAE